MKRDDSKRSFPKSFPQRRTNSSTPKKQRGVACRGGLRPVFCQQRTGQGSIPISIAIVTVFVLTLVFPPFMFSPLAALAPAALLLFAQFVAPVIGLAAVVAVAFYRFVQLPLRAVDSPIAIIPIVRLRAGCSSK